MGMLATSAELVDTGLQADVCVIGSGFCGAIIAVELATAGIDVLLLEAGSEAPDHRLDAMLDRVEVSGGTELHFGFARQLGGASNLWAGRLAALDPIDFEQRAWVPHSGWPLSRAELEPYYARAGDILGDPGPACAAIRGRAPDVPCPPPSN